MSNEKNVECSPDCNLYIQKGSHYTLKSEILSGCVFKLQLQEAFLIERKINQLEFDSITGRL